MRKDAHSRQQSDGVASRQSENKHYHRWWFEPAFVIGIVLFLFGGPLNYFSSNPRILYLGALGISILSFYAVHKYVSLVESQQRIGQSVPDDTSKSLDSEPPNSTADTSIAKIDAGWRITGLGRKLAIEATGMVELSPHTNGLIASLRNVGSPAPLSGCMLLLRDVRDFDPSAGWFTDNNAFPPIQLVKPTRISARSKHGTDWLARVGTDILYAGERIGTSRVAYPWPDRNERRMLWKLHLIVDAQGEERWHVYLHMIWSIGDHQPQIILDEQEAIKTFRSLPPIAGK